MIVAYPSSRISHISEKECQLPPTHNHTEEASYAQHCDTTCDSNFIKFKNRQKRSAGIGVQIMVTWGRGLDQEGPREPVGAGTLGVLIWVGVPLGENTCSSTCELCAHSRPARYAHYLQLYVKLPQNLAAINNERYYLTGSL